MRDHLVRTLALLLALCGLAALSVAPASAHDRIVGSDPADGSELSASPTQITLTFSDEVQPVGGQILLVDAAGSQVAAGVPAVDGVSAALPVPALANGSYSVTWRVVSSDGHPIDGTFAFSVADPASTVEPAPEVTALDEPVVEPTAEPTADPTAGPTAVPSPEVTPGPEESAADAGADASQGGSDDSVPWTGIVVGGILGLLAGTGLLLFSRRRKAKD